MWSNNFFDDKFTLVTSGTGSFGIKFADLTLTYHAPKEIVIFSHGEMKYHEMIQEYSRDKRVRFVISPYRDKDSIKRVLTNIDLADHADAAKIVPVLEFNRQKC